MSEIPDYVYQNWLKESYEGTSKKQLKVYLLKKILNVLQDIKKASGTRISPS